MPLDDRYQLAFKLYPYERSALIRTPTPRCVIRWW